MFIKQIKFFILILAVGFYSHIENAQAQGQRQIPKEMIAACQGKQDNDACTITTPKGDKLDGMCHQKPNGDSQLLCLPKPPQEAFDACQGKNDGDNCSITTPDKQTLNGTCRKGPGGAGDLACIPAPNKNNDK